MTEDAEQPLAGKRILVTRTREQGEGLVDRLHSLGASVLVVPLIATVPIAEPDAIVRTAAEMGSAASPRWVAFTSATAARVVIGATGPESLSTLLVAAVGSATAGALDDLGVAQELVATEPDAAGLARAMLARGVQGAVVWLPSAEGARDDLAEALHNGGASVVVQLIYRSVMPISAPEQLSAALDRGVDAITLTSGSTARNLRTALGDRSLPSAAQIVCIGEQTASEARAAGLPVHAIAGSASVDGLVRALIERLTPQQLG